MTQRIDFKNLCAPTTDTDALRIIISQTVLYIIWIYFYDVSNPSFHKYFSFTMRKINELSFLNFRIIQSKHGISFDKSNNIKQKILNE